MSPSPHHLLARFVVGAVLAVPTVYFATVLFPAIRDVSLSEGFSHIRSNVWATCALIDYVAGLCFTVPYMWFRSPNLVVGVIVVVACTILGNVVSVALFVVLIWTGRGTLRDSVLPLHHTLHAPNTKTWGVLVFQWCIGTLGLIYWAYLFYALATESVPDGWDFIRSDTWAYVTLVDVLTGISMVTTYVLVRELREGNVAIAMLWVAGLFFLGNGVTIVYLLYISAGPMAGRSLQEVLLWGESEAFSERAPLVKSH